VLQAKRFYADIDEAIYTSSGSLIQGSKTSYKEVIEGGSNVLENANFAQKTFSNTFSPEGIKKYSELAGQPIKTIDDLSAALKSGKISPSNLPVEYIVRDGNALILNTRTS
jgi:filamentous hemagglutinin